MNLFTIPCWWLKSSLHNIFHHVFQAVDSDKRRHSSSRNGSTSRKALLSSSRGSGDPSDPNRSSHLVPTTTTTSRPSTNQRLHQSTGLEGRTSSFPKPGRIGHDDPTMRSFERLTISAERRKWIFGRAKDLSCSHWRVYWFTEYPFGSRWCLLMSKLNDSVLCMMLSSAHSGARRILAQMIWVLYIRLTLLPNG